MQKRGKKPNTTVGVVEENHNGASNNSAGLSVVEAPAVEKTEAAQPAYEPGEFIMRTHVQAQIVGRTKRLDQLNDMRKEGIQRLQEIAQAIHEERGAIAGLQALIAPAAGQAAKG